MISVERIYNVGDIITFKFTINNVNTAQTNVVVDTMIPSNFSLVSVDADKGSYNGSQFVVGAMEPGESLTVRTDYRLDSFVGTAEQTVTFRAEVMGIDTLLNNNVVEDTLVISPAILCPTDIEGFITSCLCGDLTEYGESCQAQGGVPSVEFNDDLVNASEVHQDGFKVDFEGIIDPTMSTSVTFNVYCTEGGVQTLLHENVSYTIYPQLNGKGVFDHSLLAVNDNGVPKVLLQNADGTTISTLNLASPDDSVGITIDPVSGTVNFVGASVQEGNNIQVSLATDPSSGANLFTVNGWRTFYQNGLINVVDPAGVLTQSPVLSGDVDNVAEVGTDGGLKVTCAAINGCASTATPVSYVNPNTGSTVTIPAGTQITEVLQAAIDAALNTEISLQDPNSSWDASDLVLTLQESDGSTNVTIDFKPFITDVALDPSCTNDGLSLVTSTGVNGQQVFTLCFDIQDALDTLASAGTLIQNDVVVVRQADGTFVTKSYVLNDIYVDSLQWDATTETLTAGRTDANSVSVQIPLPTPNVYNWFYDAGAQEYVWMENGVEIRRVGVPPLFHGPASLSSGAGTLLDPLNVTVDWTDIQNIPAGFADNVDNDTVSPTYTINVNGGDLELLADGVVVNTAPLPSGADNWGSQVIQHAAGSLSTGDGTAGNPLAVAVQWSDIINIPAGFADNVDNDTVSPLYTLNINGGALELLADGVVIDSEPLPSGADNWGSQVAATDATINGDGTAVSPLSVANPFDESLISLTRDGDELVLSYDGSEVGRQNICCAVDPFIFVANQDVGDITTGLLQILDLSANVSANSECTPATYIVGAQSNVSVTFNDIDDVQVTPSADGPFSFAYTGTCADGSTTNSGVVTGNGVSTVVAPSISAGDLVNQDGTTGTLFSVDANPQITASANCPAISYAVSNITNALVVDNSDGTFDVTISADGAYSFDYTVTCSDGSTSDTGTISGVGSTVPTVTAGDLPGQDGTTGTLFAVDANPQITASANCLPVTYATSNVVNATVVDNSDGTFDVTISADGAYSFDYTVTCSDGSTADTGTISGVGSTLPTVTAGDLPGQDGTTGVLFAVDANPQITASANCLPVTYAVSNIVNSTVVDNSDGTFDVTISADGAYSFDYTVTCSDGSTADTGTISGVGAAVPTVTAGDLTGQDGTTGTLFSVDANPQITASANCLPVTYAVSDIINAVVVDNSDGTFDVTISADGAYSFDYTVTCSDGSTSDTGAISGVGASLPTVTAGDLTGQDGTEGVLIVADANPQITASANCLPVTYATSNVVNATVVDNSDGTFDVTPTAAGAYSFDYTVTCSDGSTADTGTISGTAVAAPQDVLCCPNATSFGLSRSGLGVFAQNETAGPSVYVGQVDGTGSAGLGISAGSWSLPMTFNYSINGIPQPSVAVTTGDQVIPIPVLAEGDFIEGELVEPTYGSIYSFAKTIFLDVFNSSFPSGQGAWFDNLTGCPAGPNQVTLFSQYSNNSESSGGVPTPTGSTGTTVEYSFDGGVTWTPEVIGSPNVATFTPTSLPFKATVCVRLLDASSNVLYTDCSSAVADCI